MLVDLLDERHEPAGAVIVTRLRAGQVALLPAFHRLGCPHARLAWPADRHTPGPSPPCWAVPRPCLRVHNQSSRPQQPSQQRYGAGVAATVRNLEEQLEASTAALRASEAARLELSADYRHALNALWKANAGLSTRREQ